MDRSDLLDSGYESFLGGDGDNGGMHWGVDREYYGEDGVYSGDDKGVERTYSGESGG